jgi:hypothetical protein
VIVPLADWYTPLGICDDADDPLPILAPYYCCLVEAIVPLAVSDVLTARGWQWAKDALDQKPVPKTLLDWSSRWRNFLGTCWSLVEAHQDRLAKIERARARKKKPAAPVAPAPTTQGELVMPAVPPPREILEL